MMNLYERVKENVSDIKGGVQEFYAGYRASGVQVNKIRMMASAGAEGSLRGGSGAVIESYAHQSEIAFAMEDVEKGELRCFDAGYLMRYLVHKKEREFVDEFHDSLRNMHN